MSFPIREEFEHRNSENLEALVFTFINTGDIRRRTSVDYIGQLPTENNQVNDFIVVNEDGFVRAWDGASRVLTTELLPFYPPSGNDGEVQFMDGGVFGSDSNFFWDDTNKRLGVGTNTPKSSFEVKSTSNTRLTVSAGSSANNSTLLIDGGFSASSILEMKNTLGTGGSIIYNHPGAYMSFWTANLERVRVDSGGNFGIGTTTPLSKLHINGGVGGFETGLTFGDGDSGIYELVDDVLNFVVGGSITTQFRPTITYGVVSSLSIAWGILNSTTSPTTPIFLPYGNDLDTGVGGSGDDQLSLIAGGVEGIRIVEAGTIYAEHKGGTRKPITTITTATYTITLSDSTILLDGTTNTVTATLPTAVGNTGQIFSVQCIDDTNVCTLQGDGVELIQDTNSRTVGKYNTMKVQSDGTQRRII